MNRYARLGLLLAGLGLTTLLVGCPGMPGAPGGTSAAQQTPPGVQPPPGLKSGGVRTLLGTTVTPPDNSILLVTYKTTTGVSGQNIAVRRLTISENTVVFEGLNYDERNPNLPKDTNTIIPLAQITSLTWNYEAQPTPPPTAGGPPPGKGGAAPAPGGSTRGGK